MSRRLFLRTIAASAASIPLIPAHSNAVEESAPSNSLSELPDIGSKSRVVQVSSPGVANHFNLDAKRIPEMLSRGICLLSGESNAQKAWQSLFKPQDIIGIKVNCAAGPYLCSHLEIVMAVLAGLQSAGIKESNIIVWDKSRDQMIHSGYPYQLDGDGWKCYATEPDGSYDPEVFYEADYSGKLIWGDHEFGQSLEQAPENAISNKSYFSKILTQRITKLINIPVLMAHQKVGISGCLLNVCLGSIDNTRRFFQYPDLYQSLMFDICSARWLQKKWTLNIMDGLLAQYSDGPQFHPEYVWSFNSMLLSKDPVAIDAIGLKEINARRKTLGLDLLKEPLAYLQAAAESGIGTADIHQTERLAAVVEG